jgi:hypothetical protein
MGFAEVHVAHTRLVGQPALCCCPYFFRDKWMPEVLGALEKVKIRGVSV